MPSMKFANILLETNPRSVSFPAMYCRSDQPVVFDSDEGYWLMYAAGEYDYTTYFNSLSVMKLQHYTSAHAFSLHLELKGAACTVQQTMGDAFAAHSIPVDGTEHELKASKDWQVLDIPLEVTDSMVIIGFKILTEGKVYIRNSYYELQLSDEFNPVELAVGTTTFKKESFIINNINLVQHQILDSDDDIAKHFHMYVIDNGRTLDAQELSNDRITVIPNDNVGGAGGFTRAMLAAMQQKPQATNVLLMDDDVAVSAESIKRTYNLLRILKKNYRNDLISGAMLNYEIGEDQHEDVGFINQEGYCTACKPPLHLTKFEDLIYNELFTPTKEMLGRRYAAWWYCCIPMDLIKKTGMPLPFFVREDDAEYGVRCHTDFITMNSLCVWHMPFDRRYNAAVERYQALRNPLIAQATTDFIPNANFVGMVHDNVRLELKKFGYDNAELCLDALEDFLKGPDFFSRRGQAEKSFMNANKQKEKLVDFEELERQIALDPDLAGFDLAKVDRQFIDSDVPRTISERVNDLITDNGQRVLHNDGKGYAVIPAQGWVYPAGVIRGKKKLIVIDWYNRTGAIRERDNERYAQIKHRYQRDMRYYRQNIERLRKEYAAARPRLTSVEFWKHYLKMD